MGVDSGDAAQSRFSILKLKSLKDQNRVADQKNLLQELKIKHNSLCNVAEHYNIRWPTFHEMCQLHKEQYLKYLSTLALHFFINTGNMVHFVMFKQP